MNDEFYATQERALMRAITFAKRAMLGPMNLATKLERRKALDAAREALRLHRLNRFNTPE
jgi:hypothetical protein